MSNITMLNGIFDYIRDIGNILMYGLVAVIVVICIVLMSKYEGSRKILLYVIGVVILGTGIYSGFGLAEEISSHSYVNGTFEELNKKELETFKYNTTTMLFSLDNDKYIFETELDKVENFNAQENIYSVKFNDYTLLDQITYSAGSIYLVVPIEFLGIDGAIDSSPTMYISVKFLSNKTKMEVWCFGEQNKEYISQYIKDFGFRLLVEKIN